MTQDVFKHISDTLTNAGINYEFGTWNGETVYPYFVGEYQEPESLTEDGLQECDFTITGFTRESWLELEVEKGKIEKLFSNDVRMLPNGSGVGIFYAGSLIVPTGDMELKRIEINLRIKEWKVN